MDGDWDFVMDMLSRFCVIAKEQLELCVKAANSRDVAALNFEAHSIKGGAATCCAAKLAASCGTLERMARIEKQRLESDSTVTNDAAAATSPPPPPPPSSEDWMRKVDDVAACLSKVSDNVNALSSMRTLIFNSLKDVCGGYTDDIVGALTDLLEVSVNAYISACAAINPKKTTADNNVDESRLPPGEAPFTVAREKLCLARAAANALSIDDLARTMGLLSDHLAKASPRVTAAAAAGGSPSKTTTALDLDEKAFRVQSEHRLYDVRGTVEALAAELALILGEKMPVIAVPFDEEDSAGGGAGSGEASALLAGSRRKSRASRESADRSESGDEDFYDLETTDWVGEPICNYYALIQNIGEDHKFVAALLSDFNDSLSKFSSDVTRGVGASSGDQDEKKPVLFEAHILHGAAVSMCAPRVTAAISDFIVAIKEAQEDDINDENTIDEDTVGNVQSAADEFARFVEALEKGDPPSTAMLRPTPFSASVCF